MLGGARGCGGVSWWCSEVWRCSPKVAPDTDASTDMANCDQCNVKFSLLKRRRTCATCALVFCSACIKTAIGGARKCNKCIILSQWPLDVSEVGALRVKDLRHYLHSQHINTTTCKEKRELIELVTRHICSQRRVSDASRQASSSRDSRNFSNVTRQPVFRPPTSNVTRDDGIRVRPSSASYSEYVGAGSIRVRPVDSPEERPDPPISPDSNEYDPEMDLGIRVFASDSQASGTGRVSSTSPVSMEGCSESTEDKCSQCPSEDCTASSCSLDSCPNRTSSQQVTCPLHNESSAADSLDDFVVVQEFQSGDIGISTHTEAGTNTHAEQEREGIVGDAGAGVSYPHIASGMEEETPTTTTSSASSSTPPSTASSPEPSKPVGSGSVSLKDLTSLEDIKRLTVRQCKEILALHRVSYSGIREKSELLFKIEMLWKDYQASRQDIEDLPDDMLCKICMDGAIDCVFLECGHMVACTQCGKQMSECPVCRQFVVRVVRTFRA